MLQLIPYLPLLVLCGYAILKYDRFQTELWPFIWYIFLSTLVQLLSEVSILFQLNNLPILHFFVPTSFLLLTEFYNRILNDHLNKLILRVIGWAFVVFSLINTFFVQLLWTFNSNSLTVESIVLVIISLSTFMLLIGAEAKEQKGTSLLSLQWINSGLFLYHTSNLLLFYFGKIIMHSFSSGLSQYTWLLHSLFATIMYVFFFIGLWKSPKQ